LLNRRPPGFWIAMSLLGMMAGTAFGEAMAVVLPDSATTLRAFFAGSMEFALGPFRLDLIVMRFSLEEIAFRVNLMSFLGLILVGTLYRWF
jgi:hypothetical protein